MKKSVSQLVILIYILPLQGHCLWLYSDITWCYNQHYYKHESEYRLHFPGVDTKYCTTLFLMMSILSTRVQNTDCIFFVIKIINFQNALQQRSLFYFDNAKWHVGNITLCNLYITHFLCGFILINLQSRNWRWDLFIAKDQSTTEKKAFFGVLLFRASYWFSFDDLHKKIHNHIVWNNIGKNIFQGIFPGRVQLNMSSC